MFFPKLIIWFCLFVLGQLLWAKSALAWGPGVHTVIALNMLDDVSLILPSIARVISSFPLEYLYGCLAADFFIGKSKMRKAGHAHSWKGGFRFLNEADDDQEMAYAYGFLSHLAADVVAHNFFVPNMTSKYRALRKKSHLYWEIRADYLVGQEYTKIARDVLAMDHRGCDNLLKAISGKKKKGLGARKLVYTQSVKISDRAYTTHHMVFPDKVVGRHSFNEYAAFMVGLSSRVVKGFLKYPETSPCLSHDPIGIRTLALARRNNGSLAKWLNMRRPVRSFAEGSHKNKFTFLREP
ncbi:MAG: zinc dependent phospholipase C family protein [Deltaproteobacteria bacterium]|nr:zinc dependent phospholipase C family protein [Deltaproteobacteria bacterium]